MNGCVYCASVHAQRFQQLAKREDVIQQIFAAPETAGTTERERAIVRYAIDLTLQPQALTPESLDALRRAGLDDAQILDLSHAIAIFAWANRLMLTPGEPVFPA
ncbi:putative peroxidase-related enzyme [Paraburkholderia sp. JPY465]